MTTAKAFQNWPTTLFNPWQQSMNFSFEPFVKLNGITIQFYNEITKENTHAINDTIQNNSELIQKLSHTKDINEILSAQRNWASKTTLEFFQYAKHMQDILLKYATNFNGCFLKSPKQSETKEKTQK